MVMNNNLDNLMNLLNNIEIPNDSLAEIKTETYSSDSESLEDEEADNRINFN